MGIRAPEGGLPKCGKKQRNFTSETFSKIWSRFHLTRKIALNEEYLSQFCPDRKVLWMTLKQLFEIFIKFKCLIASEQYLHMYMDFLQL